MLYHTRCRRCGTRYGADHLCCSMLHEASRSPLQATPATHRQHAEAAGQLCPRRTHRSHAKTNVAGTSSGLHWPRHKSRAPLVITGGATSGMQNTPVRRRVQCGAQVVRCKWLQRTRPALPLKEGVAGACLGAHPGSQAPFPALGTRQQPFAPALGTRHAAAQWQPLTATQSFSAWAPPPYPEAGLEQPPAPLPLHMLARRTTHSALDLNTFLPTLALPAASPSGETGPGAACT
jgi:hypothetical protein